MAGESWKIGSGTITQSVVKNALNEIRKYIINGTSATYSGYYTAGTLIKTRIKDPQGNETYEYYNSEERLIATQQHLGSDSRFTYNVYDNLGLVRYVIPSIQAATFTSGTKSLATLQKYCYYAEYDKFQRPYTNNISQVQATQQTFMTKEVE